VHRRTLIKLGVAGGALAALAAGGLALTRPGLRDGALTPAGREVFEAVARAVLEGSLPVDPAARGTALRSHLQRLDATIAALAPAMQAEIGQLTTVLASRAGRWLVTGLKSEWPAADAAEMQAMLQSLRTSSVNLRLQVFHALRDLTNAAYFADPGTWPAIGYPGPLDV
jgi:hypothetical protein